jgi:hypothetical protein
MKIPGGITDGETPLPIPNREVKPIRADGTILVTVWKSRSLPGFSFYSHKKKNHDYNDERNNCGDIISCLFEATELDTIFYFCIIRHDD